MAGTVDASNVQPAPLGGSRGLSEEWKRAWRLPYCLGLGVRRDMGTVVSRLIMGRSGDYFMASRAFKSTHSAVGSEGFSK